MIHHRYLKLSEPERILFWSANLWNFSDGLLGPLFAVFASRIGGDIMDISWAWAIYLAVTGFGMAAVGVIGDKVGHHALSVVGYAFTAVFTFGYLFVESPFDLFIVQAGLGLGLAFSNPTWEALYDRYSGSGKNDGYIWGVASAGRSISQAAAILVGAYIVTTFSFDVLFVAMGILATVAALYQAKILRYARR